MTRSSSPGQVLERTVAVSQPTDARGAGRHIILECWECNDKLNSPEVIEEALREAVRRAKVTLLGIHIHEFQPQGLTAVAIIAESHILIHTWPEYSYLAFDAFTCGEDAMPEEAVKVIKEVFEPRRTKTLELTRGIWA